MTILDKNGNEINTTNNWDFGLSIRKWWEDRLQKELMKPLWFDKLLPSPILDQHGKNYDRPIKVSKANDKIRFPISYGEMK